LQKRALDTIKLAKESNLGIFNMNFYKLKMLKKAEGKFKMAEAFCADYRQAQIFYKWLILASRRQLY